jgi:hypothetical protein
LCAWTVGLLYCSLPTFDTAPLTSPYGSGSAGHLELSPPIHRPAGAFPDDCAVAVRRERSGPVETLLHATSVCCDSAATVNAIREVGQVIDAATGVT